MKFSPASVVAAATTVLWSVFSVSAQPASDECISATNIPITALPYTAIVDITSYTSNPLDTSTTDTTCALPGRTMWWKITPPADGVLALYTYGSFGSDLKLNIDTFIGSCDSNTRVVCGYDFGYIESLSYPIVHADVTYYIKVGETVENSGSGTFNFTIQFDPYNLAASGDECSDAKRIPHASLPFNEIVDTRLYSNNENDTIASCTDFENEGNTVYYQYTPPFNGLMIVDTSGSVDVVNGFVLEQVVSVFTGGCGTLTETFCANLKDTETVYYPVTAGVAYTIKVGESFGSPFGIGLVNFSLSLQRNYFNVYDEDSEKTIAVLNDMYNGQNVFSSRSTETSSSTINYALLDSTALAIKPVFTTSNSIKSVRLTLDNRTDLSICDNKNTQSSPGYRMFGEGGVEAKPFTIGNRVIAATAYSQSDCRGRVLGTASQEFVVKGCDYLRYGLYDAQRDIYLSNLYNGSIALNPPCKVSIGVTFECGFVPVKVRFELRKASNNVLVTSRDETQLPYFLFGDNGLGNIYPGSIPAGEYTITAIIDNIVHPSVRFTLGACKATPVVDKTFDIDLRFASRYSSELTNLFQPVVKRISSLVGDKPDFTNGTDLARDYFCGDYPSRIDDLNVCVYFDEEIDDGVGGILGAVFSGETRPVDGLPLSATLILDVDDLSEMVKQGKSDSYLLQQLMETLGLGEYWEQSGLVSSGSPPTCSYNGTRAKAEFKAITGCTADVPLEQNSIPERPGVGDYYGNCRFWDPVCLKNEVWTYTLGVKKVSRITLAALQDIGYTVNYTAADPYGTSDIGVCRGCNRRHLKTSAVVEEPKKSSCHSGIVHERAVRHGRKVLRNVHDHHMEQRKRTLFAEDVTFDGSQRITVAYQHEDGTICSTVVPADFLV